MIKRYLSSFLAIIAICAVLISCSSNSPKVTAEKFLSCIYQLDYNGAKSVATDDTKKMLDMYEQFTQNLPDSMKQQFKKIKIDVKSVKEEKDNATVTYTTTDFPKEQTLHLVKQNGKWLAHWTKEDTKTDEGEQGTDQTTSGDSTGAAATPPPAPVDSAKAK
jgi:GH25 family lysozyme M1 (1,4-beta-N-acetylmuramidase)